MTLANDMTQPERGQLVVARDSAISALHDFAGWLEDHLSSMPDWKPMGEANYKLPAQERAAPSARCHTSRDARQAELARYRGLEAMLKDPHMASPDPARSKNMPRSQTEFLAAYQAREKEMLDFSRHTRSSRFHRISARSSFASYPRRSSPRNPGGFMNPPGIYDADNSGFFFIPTYNAKMANSISAPRSRNLVPSLDTKAFPDISSAVDRESSA